MANGDAEITWSNRLDAVCGGYNNVGRDQRAAAELGLERISDAG